MNRETRVARGAWAATAVLVAGVVLTGCSGSGEKAASPPATPSAAAATPAAGPLAGTEWRLVEIQSMDDAVGTTRPDDPSKYTLRLNADGTANMRLDCNRANGTWSVEPSADPSNGRFEFGPLAATRALCPPPSLGERIAAQAPYVRGYLLKDGRLYLSLMADGGILAWDPVPALSFETEPDPGIEAAVLKASPSYTRDVAAAGGAIGKGRYVYARVDLNGDGKDEVLVYTLGSIFCGTGGCNLLLFTPAQDGYTLVNDFPITQNPVVVSDHKTAGWNDLFRHEAGGGAPSSYVRHVFDGKHYVERERTPGDQPPPGARFFAGDLAFGQGIPLEPRSDKAAASEPKAPELGAGGFSTVCGVTVDGKPYRYKCTVEGAAPGGPGQTTLHFPDNTVTLKWLGDNRASATFAGMNPRDVVVTTTGGTTQFLFDDRPYFWVSDRRAAELELKALR